MMKKNNIENKPLYQETKTSHYPDGQTAKLIIVIGAFGSGKSEYSVNLARFLKADGAPNITLVDLDVVNPYFRSRDVREHFEMDGIEVIAPEGKFKHADLPMLSPRIKGAILDKNRTVILDVGGDPIGCKTLRRFAQDAIERTYTMQFVVNTRRPFTANVTEIIEMKNTLEAFSELVVTELICNTNLMELTDVKLISEGIEIIREVAEKENLLFEKYLTMNDVKCIFPNVINGIKKINLKHYLLKPWET
jgi:hypothetical protein